MNIGGKEGEVFTVEPLQVPIPQKIEEPVEPLVEQPELVPVKKDE